MDKEQSENQKLHNPRVGASCRGVRPAVADISGVGSGLSRITWLVYSWSCVSRTKYARIILCSNERDGLH